MNMNNNCYNCYIQDLKKVSRHKCSFFLTAGQFFLIKTHND